MLSINSNNNRSNLIGQCILNNDLNSEILPSFTLYLTVNICILQCNSMNTMAPHKEISRLVTNMNISTGSGRPSRNSQGTHNTMLQPAMPTHPLLETPVNPATVPSTPVASPLARSILPDNSSHAVTDTSYPNSPVPISSQYKQVVELMPCMRQHDRFVDPAGKPLQPGNVIFCENLPFIVSNNGKIYNYTGHNMKQLYIADPSKHKYLVKDANRPSTFANILDLVLGLLPGFHKRQNQSYNTKDVEDQEQATPETSTIETISTMDSGKNSEMGNHVINTTEDNAFLNGVHNTSDLADFYVNTSTQNDMHNSGSFPTETAFPNSCKCNEMFSHYNHILIGYFKDIFQHVHTNNLSAVLQALKELNFILANRAPELSAHYGISLEPQHVFAEEVLNFVSTYLTRPTANTIEHSSRGRPRTRGNQHNQYTRESSLVLRYNQQTHRSDIHAYSNKDRSYNQTSYDNRNSHHSHSSLNHSCNPVNNSYHDTSSMPCNIDMHTSNTSDILGSLQSQILGLQTHPLQQSTQNSIKIFDGSNKADFTAWAQSIPNAARLCHLNTLSIALSKLQGVPLKSANYLEAKETNTGKTLIWSTLKQHLTSNYSKIPYDTHAINAYDMLQQGNDESTKAYLHRVQDT